MCVAAWVHQQRKAKGVLGWCVLGLFFVGLSLDESAAIHEVLVPRAQTLLVDNATGMLYYAWYVPVLLLCSILLMILWPFLRSLPGGRSGCWAWAWRCTCAARWFLRR